ncbi:MAG: thermostable hemolysin [Pseudomonadota bacterium]
MQMQSETRRASIVPCPERAAASGSTLALALMDSAHSERALAEAFVRTVFQRAYGARLGALYPLLLGLTRPAGDYAAVAGIRPAGNTRLFSEHYLDQPVDQLLAAARSGIAEIGNLAPASAGQARWLICTVSAFLMGAGFTHVVFTLVPKLRNAFSRMGLPLTRLADARCTCLPADQQAEWGSYYDCQPAVYAGDIVAGTPALRALLAADPDLQQLSQRAYAAGQVFARSGAVPLS